MENNYYITRKLKINNEKPLKVINKFVKSEYGQFIYALESDENSFSLNASLPYEIQDGDNIYLRFDRYKDIYYPDIEILKNNFLNITTLNKKRLSNLIGNLENKKITKTENLLLEIANKNFSKINSINTFYFPIKEILIYLHENANMIIEKNDKKLLKYADFLKSLGILTISENNDKINLTLGENYKNIERTSMDSINDLFDYVLSRGNEYINKSLKIKALSPYLRISTSFYYNIINLRRNYTINQEQLIDEYNNMYNKKMDKNKFPLYIKELINVKILEKNDSKITGNDKIVNKFIKS